MVGILELSGDGFVTVQGWVVLNLLFSQIDGDLLLSFIHEARRRRGDQHCLPVSQSPVSTTGWFAIRWWSSKWNSLTLPISLSRLFNLQPCSVLVLLGMEVIHSFSEFRFYSLLTPD